MPNKLFHFGFGNADSDGSDKALLGGKGAGLCHMSKLGLPVPPGFIISTDACIMYMSMFPGAQEHFVRGLAKDAEDAVRYLELALDRKVLVSVRSGARVSMPGMMDTILNVGITPSNLEGFRKLLGADAADDCAKRLFHMYTTTCGVTGVPSTRVEQLEGAIKAVFDSWNSERAVEYRKVNNIPNDWGTAVTIQVMVYGNLNNHSCSGVLFTRDPLTGENKVTGEFLPNAQGEDVVAGTHTPQSLDELSDWDSGVWFNLKTMVQLLETNYRDMQDVEFTVEDGRLYLLQTRSAKRSARAAFRVARDMAIEGLITKAEAVKRVTAKQYMAIKTPVIDPAFKIEPTATGTPACAGLVSGVAVFSNAEAKASKVPCILVAEETTPDDYPGMVASVGVLTAKGGATSHAAVVARGMDKPCVVGAGPLTVAPGSTVTLDGATGRVWVNVEVPIVVGSVDSPGVAEVVGWAVADSNVLARYPVTGLVDPVLPASGRVVADVSASVEGESTAALKASLTRLRATNLTGIISCREGAATASADDAVFLGWLGLAENNVPAKEKSLAPTLKALKASTWTAAFKNRWVLELPAWASPEHRAELVSAGWRLVVEVKTLDQLLSTNGIVIPHDNLWSEVSKGSFDKLLTVLKQSGKKVDAMPQVVSVDELVFAVLGK